MLKLLDIVCILASFGWVGFKPMIHGDDIMAKQLGPLRWRWTCASLDATSWQQVEEIYCRETVSHLSTESSSQTMKTLLSCTSLLSALWPWISSFSCQCCWLLQCRWQWEEQTFLSICLDMSRFIKEDPGLGGSWKMLGNTAVRPLFNVYVLNRIESIDHIRKVSSKVISGLCDSKCSAS